VYSIKVAAVSTVLCLLLGYPMAYAIARSSPTYRNVFLMLVILPFWTSFLLRVYAWIGLLKTDGVINNILQGLGLIDEPLTMMYTSFAVYIGIVYSYLPFMILPLYSNLEKHDMTLLEAASDLGAGPVRAFVRITMPFGRVLPEPRLAEGERGGDRDAVAAGRADHAVPALPEQRTAGPKKMKAQK
jgi:putrescine transport system permease protein